MKYYKQFDASGKLAAISKGSGGTEITEEEYNRLLEEIRAKAKWVDDVYNGTPLADVPAEWQEEIYQRVDERMRQETEQATQDISDEEIADAVEAIL